MTRRSKRPAHAARGLAALRGCLLTFVLATAAAAAAEPTPAPEARPTPSAVVLITVDTLRADSVSFNGYGLPTTPFLDSLARDGVVFTQAYAPSSWTPPSMASLFTGVFPSSHGITFGEDARSLVGLAILPDSFATLAEFMRAAGYPSVGVSSNRHLTRSTGFAQGFDAFYDPPNFPNAKVVNDQVRLQLREAFGPSWKTAWRERKLFLWIHYFDPHDPYMPYPPWLGKNAPGFRRQDAPIGIHMKRLKEVYPQPDAALAAAIRPLYDSEIARVDDHIRQIWEELGFDDDVLLIMTSDHGEEIVDHGNLGHSHSLYEELVRVPLLLRWPKGLQAGRRIEAPVSVVDVFPTLVELLGLPMPAGLQGRSLVEALGQAAVAPRPVFCELLPTKPPRTAIRDGQWKLIRDEAEPLRSQLFDLRADPHEATDLSAQHPEVLRRLDALLQQWKQTLPPPPFVQTLGITDR